MIGITEANILQRLWEKFPGKRLHDDPYFYDAKRYLRYLCGRTAFTEITFGMIRVQMPNEDMIKIPMSKMPE